MSCAAKSTWIDDVAVAHLLMFAPMGVPVEDVGITAVCHQFWHIAAMAVGGGNRYALNFSSECGRKRVVGVELF